MKYPIKIIQKCGINKQLCVKTGAPQPVLKFNLAILARI